MRTARRCDWTNGNALLQAYHDEEWGVPVRDSVALWGKLVLDGFQAGLSWLTVLRKRDAFRKAFHGFDPDVVARFGKRDVQRLLANPGIIRSRAKIEAAIGNARVYLKMSDAGEDFGSFVWSIAGGHTIRNSWTRMSDIPASTPLSEEMSKTLKAKGFKFAGPTIVYAWMQAVGMVNDHLTSCFRYRA